MGFLYTKKHFPHLINAAVIFARVFLNVKLWFNSFVFLPSNTTYSYNCVDDLYVENINKQRNYYICIHINDYILFYILQVIIYRDKWLNMVSYLITFIGIFHYLCILLLHNVIQLVFTHFPCWQHIIALLSDRFSRFSLNYEVNF